MSQEARVAINTLMKNVSRSVIGQTHVIESLTLALLCNGNVLLEGLPGTAKTRSIKSLAAALGVNLGRVQFTPDLLPADITGSETYHDNEGRGELSFEPGPIFNELVLADEINRAPAKVQAALLEAMEERQVTVAGKTYPLPPLFLVLATQNPIEQEGTYPLPEAQMDRFLFKIRVDYPEADAELEIVRMLQREEKSSPPQDQDNAISADAIFAAREEIQRMPLSETVERYLVDIIMATRNPAKYEQLGDWIAVGSSPRASIALHRASRAQAWLKGREHVTPEDVQSVAPAVLRHRMILSYDALADGVDSDQVIAALLAQVAIG